MYTCKDNPQKKFRNNACVLVMHMGTQTSDVRYALVFCTIGKCNSKHIQTMLFGTLTSCKWILYYVLHSYSFRPNRPYNSILHVKVAGTMCTLSLRENFLQEVFIFSDRELRNLVLLIFFILCCSLQNTKCTNLYIIQEICKACST